MEALSAQIETERKTLRGFTRLGWQRDGGDRETWSQEIAEGSCRGAYECLLFLDLRAGVLKSDPESFAGRHHRLHDDPS